jgi:hypothetical protein
MPGHQDARYIPPRRKGDSSHRRRRNSFVARWLAPAAFMMVTLAVVGFILIYWRQADYSDEQRACIAQRYSQFDAKKLSQCVDVCKACMKGNTATCNTACWLKGAS